MSWTFVIGWAHFRLRLIIHDGAGTAVLQKGAHDHAAPTFVRDRVHAEQAVRLRVLPWSSESKSFLMAIMAFSFVGVGWFISGRM